MAYDAPAQERAAAAALRPRINADELIDIRQRAEFFVTLGQTDEAVQVLETRIALDGASCPQAYLDLFQLFHSLGLKADFNQLRDDFVRLFNAVVPEFSEFDDEGRSLEAYPGALDRLIRSWSHPTLLDTLEQMIYAGQDPDGGQDAFDLAAFRDILMLHAVAQTVRPGGGTSTGAFRPPPMPSTEGGAVDIDLAELFAPEAEPTQVLSPSAEAGHADAFGSVADVDLQLDVDEPAPTVPATQAGNLIDFDLSDIDAVKKSGDRS